MQKYVGAVVDICGCGGNGSFQKRSILPHGGNFCRPEGEGRKNLFLIIVHGLGHPKGVGGLTFYFLCGGGMDVFWNDPIQIFDAIPQFGEFCNKTLA
jgi:hypothetical protein